MVFLARGVGRPLWIGIGRDELLFASTKGALEVAERYLRLKLRKQELAEGTVVGVDGGEVSDQGRFHPDRDFEERALPAVRAPHEGAFCLQRLAALAAVA
jgi:hypothetical protein